MPRGAKPGERRGGREKGTLNRATADAKLAISELAKTHAPAALRTLVNVAQKGRSPASRVMAAREILDRAFGRPPQALTLGGGDTPIRHEHHDRGGEEAIQRASELLARALTAGTNTNAAAYDSHGPVLPAAIRTPEAGHGAPLAPGQNSGGAE